MVKFETYRAYSEFAEAVRRRTRFVHDPAVERFLKALVATAHKRSEILPEGSKLWRAQLGCDWEPSFDEEGEELGENPVPHPPSRMTPRQNTAPEGRANPQGIAYLYLATAMQTAMSEVRPWVGSSISVGQFVTERKLKLVNCSNDNDKKITFFLKEPKPRFREKAVWKAVNRAFSLPVTLGEDETAYVPTQVIAELFKANGYDGVAYESALGKGHNIVLFDLTSAALRSCHLFGAKSVKFTFTEAGLSYRVSNEPKKVSS